MAKKGEVETRGWFRRHWLLTGLAGLFVVIVIAIAASSGGSDDGATPVGKVGQTLTNAGTSYQLVRVTTAKRLGDAPFDEKAAGQFVVVTLRLTNKKNESKTFTDSSAKIVGGNGASYDSSTGASLLLGGDDLLFKQIQPGLKVTGRIAFDLPPSAIRGSQLVIQDLFGDGEVKFNTGL